MKQAGKLVCRQCCTVACRWRASGVAVQMECVFLANVHVGAPCLECNRIRHITCHCSPCHGIRAKSLPTQPKIMLQFCCNRCPEPREETLCAVRFQSPLY